MNLKGTVTSVFTVKDSGFKILALKVDDLKTIPVEKRNPDYPDSVSVVGLLRGVEENYVIDIVEDWENRPSGSYWPWQFKVSDVTVCEFETPVLMRRFLAGISEVGPELVKRIQNVYPNAHEIIEKSPKRLTVIKGVTEEKAMRIHRAFLEQKEKRSLDKHDEFMRELKERCAETKRYEAKPDEITFFAGRLYRGDMLMERINGNNIESFSHPIPANKAALWTSNDTQAIGLFIKFPDNSGGEIIAPLSQMCKLSLGNRAKITFVGDWSMPINKIALARVYEDMLQRENSKESVQIITVYGKAQAIMTKVYSPIGHDEFFEKIDQRIGERFGNVVSLRRGYISHKWSRATWYIGEYTTGNSKRKVELGISAIDSQTGHSGAVLQPCLFSGRKKNAMLFDDAWYSKHMALTEEGISQAVEVVHNVLDDNAQKLLDTIGITLQNPGAYAKNICEELNKLAKKMSGMQIPGKTVKTFISSVEGLSMICSNLTVWDVIEILWDLPESTGTGENYKDSLMKTVSRVINLNHANFDVA